MTPAFEAILIHGHIVADLDALEALPYPHGPASGTRGRVARRPVRLAPLLAAIRRVLRASRRALPTLAMFATLAIACADPAEPAPPIDAVASVVVAPGEWTLVVGESVRLAAIARSASGRSLEGRSITWRSSDSAVAVVAPDGAVSALRPGTATIVATSEGRSGHAALTIAPVPAARLSVTPAPLVLDVGSARRLTAVVRDAAGNVLTGRVVTWRSDAPATATVDASGLVTAVAPGYATIVASSEGATFGVAVTVGTPATPTYWLVGIGAAPLPRTLFTTVERGPDGATRDVRWDAYDGALRLDGGQYEHSIAYTLHRDGEPPASSDQVSRGTYLYDLLHGGIVFHPADASAPFRGTILPGGTVIVTRRLVPGTPELTFVHRMP